MPDASFAYAPPQSPRGLLHVDEEELVSCVACGLCLPHCPTYRVSGLERLSPRGRIAAMRAVELDGAPIDAVFRDTIDTCVQCLGCQAACPSSVPFGHLIEGTRETLAGPRAGARQRALRRGIEWLGYRFVLPNHRVLMMLTWLIAVAQRLHLVPRRLGVPRLWTRALREPLDAPIGAVPGIDTYLFTGCVMDALQRDVHRDALRVMQAAGAATAVPDRGGDCCGALHLHAGRTRDARRLARRVIASMPGDAMVVVDSAGCGAAMKDYGRLLGTREAEAFAARVRDFSEWLAARPPIAVRDTGQSVVVQDPCHLRHVQHAHLAVRQVLAPAYRLLETADDGLCCGAGGAYSVLQPELSAEIRERKVAALRAASARDAVDPPLVVSSNPGCMMHLGAAALDVRHPAELLARALMRRDDGPTRANDQEPVDA